MHLSVLFVAGLRRRWGTNLQAAERGSKVNAEYLRPGQDRLCLYSGSVHGHIVHGAQSVEFARTM
jgi:hypothetical protein